MKSTNTVFITGIPGELSLCKIIGGTEFYGFQMSAYADGTEQVINCTVSEIYKPIVEACVIQESGLSIYGSVKTFRDDDGIAKMVIAVADVSQALPFEEDENYVSVEGKLVNVKCWGATCNFHIKSTSPAGKTVWIPCTAEYQNAMAIVRAEEGCIVKVDGYIKSRLVKSNGQYLNNVHVDKLTFKKGEENNAFFKNRSRKLQGSEAS